MEGQCLSEAKESSKASQSTGLSHGTLQIVYPSGSWQGYILYMYNYIILEGDVFPSSMIPLPKVVHYVTV